MKVRKSFIAFVGMIGLMSLISCSDDWGKVYPEPGTDVYPTKEVVKTYSFEYDEGVEALSDFVLSAKGIHEVVEDETLGSNVLHLDSGYVRVANPFVGSKGLQSGAAITMWLRTDSVTLHPALFAYGEEDLVNNTTSERFFFTENSWLSYQEPKRIQALNLDENNPTEMKTGAFPTDGEWHFVALQLTTSGYRLYIDGEKKAQQDLVAERTTSFSYANLVKYLETAPYLYIGAGNDSILAETWIDDITIYRNEMDTKDWNKKRSGDEEEEFEYVVGDPIRNVGASDCTSGFWTEFSNYFRIPTNETLVLEFTNHTSGGGNWNNWNICISTDAERNGAGYKEYVVLRSDLYGWGDTYGTGTWQNEGYGDWDQFRLDMEGANVKITISRNEGKTTVDAVATATNGNIYHEWITFDSGDAADVIRAFLIVDGSYLEGITAKTQSYINMTAKTVGASDCSSGFWTEFSDYFQIPSESTLTLKFVNHTSGGGNWNNWNTCVCTDAERNGAGYKEYVVLRSDLYGWGDTYGTGTWESTGYGDWDQFRKDMEGANVVLTYTRNGGKTTFDGVSTATNGTVYREWITFDSGDAAETIRAFVLVDGSYLEMESATLSNTLF